jgi:hypothetical protein
MARSGSKANKIPLYGICRTLHYCICGLCAQITFDNRERFAKEDDEIIDPGPGYRKPRIPMFVNLRKPQ